MFSKLNKYKSDYFVEYKLAIYFIGKVASAIVTLLSIPLFIKWFGEENYGTYILAYTTFLVFMSGSLGWLNEATIKYYGVYKEDSSFLLKLEAIIIKVWLICSVLLSLVLLLTKQVQITTLPIVIVAYFFACFYTNRLVLTQVDYNAKAFVFAEFIRLSSSLTVVYLLKELTSLDADKTLFIGVAIGFIFGFFFLSKGSLPNFKMFQKRSFDKEVFKKFLVYGVPIGIWMSLSPSSNTVDRYVLSSYMGAVAIAQYTAVYDVVFKVFTQLSSPIATIIQPMLMNTYNEGNGEAYRKVRNKASIYLFLLFFPTIILLVLFDEFIIVKYLGFTEDTVVQSLKKIIIPIALSSLVWQIAILLQRKIEASGKSYIVTTAMIAVVAISAILSIYFLPKYGYSSLGYIALFTSLLYLGLILILNKK